MSDPTPPIAQTPEERAALYRAAYKSMEERKDAAYLERNRCVALLARMALVLGWPAGVTRTAIDGWSPDWHGCVYIETPGGQVSWHFHDSHAYLFAGLPEFTGEWDGHDTDAKYERILRQCMALDRDLDGDRSPSIVALLRLCLRAAQTDPRVEVTIHE